MKRDKRNRSKQRLWWISNLSHGRFLDRKILRYVTFFAFLPINLFFPNSKFRLSTNNILNINIRFRIAHLNFESSLERTRS